MQLKVRRNQRSSAMGGKIVFTLDVIVALSPDEKSLVDKYKLWSVNVYSNASADANAQAAEGGSLKALAALMADKVLKKVLSIKDLVSGEHVECKDLAELLAVEEQIRLACANLKKYLAIAVSFDGREEVVEVEQAA